MKNYVESAGLCHAKSGLAIDGDVYHYMMLMQIYINSLNPSLGAHGENDTIIDLFHARQERIHLAQQMYCSSTCLRRPLIGVVPRQRSSINTSYTLAVMMNKLGSLY